MQYNIDYYDNSLQDKLLKQKRICENLSQTRFIYLELI